MTKREKLREEYKELQETLRKLEDKTAEAVYRLVFDDNNQSGSIKYDPDNDIIRINFIRGCIDMPGSCLRSLYAALGDLLSEAQ